MDINNSYYKEAAIIDDIGTTVLGLFCFAFATFEISFAELNLQFPFLDFPIFAGEVALFLSLSLLIMKWCLIYQKFGSLHYIIFIYFLFILTKALWGYLNWGPLALRHAALFYYPLFAVCGYSFFKPDYFRRKINKILILSLLFVTMFLTINSSYKFISFILAILVITSYPKSIIKYLILFCSILFIPYKAFLGTIRTMWISNIVSGLFIILAMAFIHSRPENLALKGKDERWPLSINHNRPRLLSRGSRRLILNKYFRIFLGIAALIFLCLGLIKADRKVLESLTNLKDNISRFQIYTEIISKRENDFIMKRFKEDRLYNTDMDLARYPDNAFEPLLEIGFKKEEDRLYEPFYPIKQQLGQGNQRLFLPSQEVQPQVPLSGQVLDNPALLAQLVITPQAESPSAPVKEERGRSLATSFLNNSFRILIWRDLLEELSIKKPIFGFAFGKPFRSKSIEILNMAHGEWMRDGWIAVHNSYLEILYRSGILGILLVAAIFIILFKMVKIVIHLGSLKGLLLCGVLVNWLIAANFTIVLELPYKAVPFWSCFGMAFAFLWCRKV